MKKKHLGVVAFSTLSLMTLATIGINLSLGWLTPRTRVSFDPKNTGKSEVTYFESGDGSKDNPYIISNPRHLYNLAWLQYLGYFNQDIYTNDTTGGLTSTKTADGKLDPTYFKLVPKDIHGAQTDILDMDSMPIPPIGTSLFPFIGNFDGNGKTIKNLHTVTDIKDATIKPTSVNEKGSIDDVDIAGFFGVVGELPQSNEDAADGATKQAYQCLNFDGQVKSASATDDVKEADYVSYYASGDSTVQVNSVHDVYLDDETIKTKSSASVLAGLLVGYSNAEIKNCGVHHGNIQYGANASPLSVTNSINVGTEAKQSNYALIGDYNHRAYTWKGRADNWGGSIDLNEIHENMGKINSDTDFLYRQVNLKEGGQGGISKNEFVFNDISTLFDNYVEEGGDGSTNLLDNVALPLIGQFEDTTINNINHTQFVPSPSNIGYIVGSQIKIDEKAVSNSLRNSVSESDFDSSTNRYTKYKIWKTTTGNNDKANTDFELTSYWFDSSDISPDIKNVRDNLLSQINDTVDSDGNHILYSVRLRHQLRPKADEATYLTDMKVGGEDYPATTIGSNTSTDGTPNNIYYPSLPNNVIWFVPQHDGVARIVINTRNNGDGGGFDVYHLKRTDTNKDGNIDFLDHYSFNENENYERITDASQDAEGNYEWNTYNNEQLTKDSTTGKLTYLKDGETKTLIFKQDFTRGLLDYRFYYFEIPVKAHNEYAFGAENDSNTPYLNYMDIGQNGGDSGEDGTIQGVDFVNTDSNGNIIPLTSPDYSASNLLFYIKFADATALSFYFKRQDQSSGAWLYYYMDGSTTAPSQVRPLPSSATNRTYAESAK